MSAENPAYAETAGATRRFVEGGDGTQPGDPAKAAAAIRTALAAEQDAAAPAARRRRRRRDPRPPRPVRAEVAAWEKVSRGTDFDDAT